MCSYSLSNTCKTKKIKADPPPPLVNRVMFFKYYMNTCRAPHLEMSPK